MGRALKEIGQDIRYNPVHVKKSREGVSETFVDGVNYTYDHDTQEMREFIGDGAAFFNMALNRTLNLMDITQAEEELKIQSVCPHDFVILGKTSSGDKVELCPICGLTKCGKHGQREELIKGSPKIDVREQELSFTYPINESVLYGAIQRMTLDAAAVDPGMDIETFLTTVDSYTVSDYIRMEIKQRKMMAVGKRRIKKR